MKRITQTSGYPKQGGVFRFLATSDKDCISFIQPPPVTPPGCDTFSTTDNSFGTIPQRWAGDKFIDSFSWDYRWSVIYSTPQDSVFTDLWGNLTAEIQAEIDIEGCYCPGEGIDREILAQGLPRFPQITPLPFTWVGGGGGGGGGGVVSDPTIIESGSAPTLVQACPCDIVFDSDALTMYVESTSALNTFVVGMRGDIVIPYADYTGPFAGCVGGGSVVIQEGRISIDELDFSFGGGVVGGAVDGLIVVLKFNWNWGPYPCKGETITDVVVTAGPSTTYRTDSSGAERSEFEIIIGKVITLDNGSLCYEQYQIGDVLLEGVEIPQESIFEFTPVNDFTTEPPINSTYVRLWNGTAFNAGTSDCYPQFGPLKYLYRVLCSSGDETPKFLIEAIDECISFPSGLIYSAIPLEGIRKDANDNFGLDFSNAGNVALQFGHKIFHGLDTTINVDTLSDVNALFKFINLDDVTGNTYVGQGNKAVFVNVAEDAVEFRSILSGGTNSVIVLGGLELVGNDFGIDFDNMASGNPVLTDATMFNTAGGIKTASYGDVNDIFEFIRLTDVTGNTYAGEGNKAVFVNTAENAVEFRSIPSATTVSGFTGARDVMLDWRISDTNVILEKATITIADGLVKTFVNLSPEIIPGESCSCPCSCPSGGGGVSTWVGLTDTVNAIGAVGDHVVVNAANILSFETLPSAIVYSTIVNAGLSKTANNFGITMANIVGGSPDSTAQLLFENGGDGVPEKATLAALLGPLGADGTIAIVDDITWNGTTGELKKIRRTGVIITDGIVTNLGTLASTILFTASACPSA